MAEGKGMVPGEAVRLAGMVEYQAGSVVSRALVQKKTGTVTLFAFDEGQGLSEHTAPFDAFVEVLEGDAEVMIGGKKVVVKMGEAVLMPANVPHALRAERAFKMLLIMIRE